jgi:hypothetical protein
VTGVTETTNVTATLSANDTSTLPNSEATEADPKARTMAQGKRGPGLRGRTKSGAPVAGGGEGAGASLTGPLTRPPALLENLDRRILASALEKLSKISLDSL